MLTVSDVQIGNRADAVPSGWRFQNVLDGTRATHGQMSHLSGLQGLAATSFSCRSLQNPDGLAHLR